MKSLQVAAPEAPAPSTKTANAEPSGDDATQPWAAAYAAALEPHATSIKPGPAKHPAAKDPADPADTEEPDIDDKKITADSAGMPLALLATLSPPPPPPPATKASLAAGSDALIIASGAVADARKIAGHDAVKLPHAAPDVAANADALTRIIIDPAATHDGNAHELVAQPPVQFSLVQATPAPPPPAAPQVAPLQIDAAVSSGAWGAELGQKVVWMIGEKQHIAELRLNPPDLGPLDITLTISDHQATAVFTSPHGAVRDAVESALPRLREVLAESGIMLGNASVTSDSPRDGSAFATPQNHARRGEYAAQAGDSAPAAAHMNTDYPLRRNGLVDLFA
jgi:flagellar hook-length control protein FliK